METKEENVEYVRKSFYNYLDLKELPEEQLKEVLYGGFEKYCKDVDGLYRHITESTVEELKEECDAGVTIANSPYVDLEIMKGAANFTLDPESILKGVYKMLNRLSDISRELGKPLNSPDVICEYEKRYREDREPDYLWDAVVHPIYFPEDLCNVKYDEFGRAVDR